MAGCTSSGNTEPTRLLKNVSIEYLDFANDFRYPGAQLGYTASAPYATVCSYSYTKEIVNKVTGGFKLGTGGSSVNTYVFSANVTDTIVYSGTTVSVYTRPEYSYFSGDQPANPTIYKLNQDGRILQFTRRDGYQVNYTYNGDLIIEKNPSGDTLRVFYMENHNLVRIIKNYKDNNGVTVSVLETLFEDFDENPNPLKDKYFLVGAYYRSFSKNNFSAITRNYYVKMSNNTLKLLSTSTQTIPVSYDELGYPMFGEFLK